GISASNGATVQDNRIFNHAGDGSSTGVGLYIRSGSVSGNVVYSNATGLHLDSNSVARNNLIYGNSVLGVRMNSFQGAGQGLFNNTIYQPTGDGVFAYSSGGNTSIRDNIIAVGAGYALRVEDATQAGYRSDYNLFQIFGGGQLAFWEGRAFTTLADWAYETANDFESIIADPQFIDINGADGVLGFVGGVDGGLDDDFHLAVGSPGVDRGDPTTPFLTEPPNNGGRVDVGAYGNTAEATRSPAQLVQVLNPNGLEKYEVGQPVQIDFRTAGLTPYDAVLLLDTGASDATAVDRWNGDRYRIGGSTSSTATAVVVDGVAGAAPAALYQNWSYGAFGTNGQLSYQLPAADGDYEIVLHFTSTGNAVGANRFSIALQNAIVESNVDLRALAGTAGYRAVVLSYDVTASDGDGIRLDLTNLTNNYGATLAGIELRRVNADGVANPTVDLEVSTNGGTTWIPIAGGVEVDQYGRGSFVWNAGPLANNALIRASAHAGDVTVRDVSDRPFQIANAGTRYYVNDGSMVGNEYTTAAGDNANDGKTAATPMASLAALLRAYDLDAGDVIYVDTGVYDLATNIVLEAEDSGVTIRGPVLPTHDAVLDRGNTSSNAFGIVFAGASNVTLEYLNVTGGHHGILASGTAGNDNVTLRFVDVYNNSQHGVYITNGHGDWIIRDSRLHNNGSAGVNASSSERTRIEDNEVYGNSTGITASGGAEAERIIVSGNDVHDNASQGISASSYITVRGNRVYNHLGSGDIGIVSSSSASLVEDNDVFDNATGISTSSSGRIIGNRVFGNLGTGITSYTGLLAGNYVYSNSTGISDTGYSEIYNNLVYANTNFGIWVTYTHNAGARGVYNNTVWQDTGDAIRVVGTNNVRIRNNLLSVGNGYAINVLADGQTGFSTDWNLFDLRTGLAQVGRWGNTERATLASWQSISATHEANGFTGNPRFLDIDGADNVLGFQDVTTGNGYDDNFSLDADSDAIDAGNAYEAALTDIEGRVRHDDPATGNTGAGWDLFVESLPGGSSYAETGTALNLRSSNSATTVNLPFAFSFYGNSYTSVQVSVNGFLHFAGPNAPTASDDNSLDYFLRNARIAPLWDNLRTDTT
ncbi:MAG: right-handed parallel beta-helix repeat-containing protein, partial [Burkholderiales bacterium]|nr:right-handed parallel beta-helix repeat-containing protein [Burkholderiales bacterium]